MLAHQRPVGQASSLVQQPANRPLAVDNPYDVHTVAHDPVQHDTIADRHAACAHADFGGAGPHSGKSASRAVPAARPVRPLV